MNAARVVEAVAQLKQGKSLKLAGIGWLAVKNFPGYRGTNPQTGEAVDVPAKRAPMFTATREFKAELDGGPAERDASADTLASEIRTQLFQSGSIEIPGFGSFQVREREDRKTVSFSAAPELLSALNSAL